MGNTLDGNRKQNLFVDASSAVLDGTCVFSCPALERFVGEKTIKHKR